MVLGALATGGCGTVEKGDDPIETFTISISIAGAGSVASAPAGISCGGDCNEAFDAGTSVTLSATPAAGSAFVGWTGGSCSGTGDCTLVVSADTAVQAMFAVANTVTVTLTGTGTGTVVSTPPGISCPPTCSKPFATGQSVTLTPAPAAGTAFAGWTGGCTGTMPCTASTSAVVNVTATFSRALTCSTVANASTCATATRPELNLGMIAAANCHDQCQLAMAAAGMPSGCWIIAMNGNCYCRDGVLTTGAAQPGGVCN
jgi:hypothetical protein